MLRLLQKAVLLDECCCYSTGKLDIVVLVWLSNKYEYVNVSDQTSIFTYEIKMLIWICWKYFFSFQCTECDENSFLLKSQLRPRPSKIYSELVICTASKSSLF